MILSQSYVETKIYRLFHIIVNPVPQFFSHLFLASLSHFLKPRSTIATRLASVLVAEQLEVVVQKEFLHKVPKWIGSSWEVSQGLFFLNLGRLDRKVSSEPGPYPRYSSKRNIKLKFPPKHEAFYF